MMIGQFRAKGGWGFWGLVWKKNFLWDHSWTDILYTPQSQIPFYILQIFYFL